VAEEGFEDGLGSPELLEVLVFFHEAGGAEFEAALGADHEVLGGVLGVHELHDVGAVAHDAKNQRAEGVGDDVGGALLEDAVSQHRLERR